MTAKSVLGKVHYKFGTMIEIPRACVTATEIAEVAEFFSFGTNDLTQMTFGYSRDDAERCFLVSYVEEGILPKNPFQTMDREGVGRLMDLAVKDGRKADRTWKWVFAASTVVIRLRSSSATWWVTTTSPAPRSGCRWPAWLLPMLL